MPINHLGARGRDGRVPDTLRRGPAGGLTRGRVRAALV
jgi:hypothetical protein